MPILTGTGDAAILEVSEDIATVEAAVVQLDADLTTAEGNIDDLEAVLLPTAGSTQLRAPAAGNIALQTSAGDSQMYLGPNLITVSPAADGVANLRLEDTHTRVLNRPFSVRSNATFETAAGSTYCTLDSVNSSVVTTGDVTVGGDLTVGTTNIGGSVDTLNDRFVISGPNTYIKSTGGFVGFADAGGARTMWMDDGASQLVSDYGCQFRSTFQTYTNLGAGLRLMLGVDAAAGNITFRDPASNSNYVVTDAAARKTLIPSGATLQINGTLTVPSGGRLECPVGSTVVIDSTPIFNRGYEKGLFDVTLDYTANTPNAAPTTYVDQETAFGVIHKIWHHSINFSNPFNSTPVCSISLRSTDKTACRASVWVHSVNSVAVTFAICINGAVPQLFFDWTAIAFDSD
jgi:hypothetical protein